MKKPVLKKGAYIFVCCILMLNSCCIESQSREKTYKSPEASFSLKNNQKRKGKDCMDISGKIFKVIQTCFLELDPKDTIIEYQISVEVEDPVYYVVSFSKIKASPILGGGDPVFYVRRDNLKIEKKLKQK